ncbi:MAG: hypothetical protein KF724_07360 [Phycisphaeraceae bacterium]|nr:hypothetical protein [Phycisphaeraceae bacterium]
MASIHRSRAVCLSLVLLGAAGALSSCRDQGPAPRPPTPVAERPSAPSGGAARVQPGDAPAGARGPDGSVTTGGGDTARAQTPGERLASPPPGISGPDSDPTRIEIGGLVMPKPVTWVWQPPSMQFRTLQYGVPAPGGATPAAELIFSVFPVGDGGPIDPNIDRWAGQFRTPEGGPVTPTNRSVREVEGLRLTRVDLAGAYMGMGAAAPRPETAQLAVIVEAPDSRVFIRLLGPAATVEAARSDFDALVEGIRPAASR